MTIKYIDLNRTYSEFSQDYKSDDNEAFYNQSIISDKITFDNLLENERSLVLSEAGTGKTTELLEGAKKLKSQNKFVFFLRLENLNGDFEDAFEVGKKSEFDDFINSDENGWVFLDSIDEAKLHSIRDYQNAVRKLSRKLDNALHRTKIIISGRTTMFKPKTDLSFLNDALCVEVQSKKQLDEPKIIPKSVGSNSYEEHNSQEDERKKQEFKAYKLNDLSIEQIKEYVAAIKLENSSEFIKSIIDNEFLEFACRPQDLIELTNYWQEKKELKSRVEVMDFNIGMKLRERDERLASNLSNKELLDGAKFIAAASIICKQQNIQIEDEPSNDGIRPTKLLNDWNDTQIRALLLKPIFDESLYGKVRFHHRTVKEYLCAQWFKSKIDAGVSKRLIINQFFKEQYGEMVVVPSRRPVLPWLVLLDNDICDEAVKYAPEIFLEGGDSTKIPLHIKQKILINICETKVHKKGYQADFDSDAMKRFAIQELSEIIKKYLTMDSAGKELKIILLNLIQYGKLDGFTDICSKIVLDNSCADYIRVVAIRAINSSSDNIGKIKLREAILKNGRNIDRGIISELINDLDYSEDNIIWLIKILQRSEFLDEHQFDFTHRIISEYANKLPLNYKILFLKLLSKLINYPPFMEYGHVNISKRHNWLLPCFAEIIVGLINNHEALILENCLLSTINKISFEKNYNYYSDSELINSIGKAVGKWPELKYKLYWNAMELLRQNINDNIASYSPFSIGCFSNFNKEDFDYFLSEISKRSSQADKYIAFDMMLDLYRLRGENIEDKEKIISTLSIDCEFLNRFEEKSKPVEKTELPEWKKWEIKDKKERRRYKAKSKIIKFKNSKWYESHLEEIRNCGKTGLINQALVDLYHSTLNKEGLSSKWASDNWKSLIEIESKNVAEAYRDALLELWKNIEPELKSQKLEKNNTKTTTILSLSGLGIYAKTDSQWLEKITKEQAKKALQFGMCELNGFPFWFEELVKAYPNEAKAIIIGEMDWAFNEQNKSLVSSYPFQQIADYGKLLWASLAPYLIEKLDEYNNIPLQDITYIFKIIVNSGIIEEANIIKLIETRLSKPLLEDEKAFWITKYISFMPQKGIECFKQEYDAIIKYDDKKTFAERIIAGFDIIRSNENIISENYKNPQILKELYLLSHQYIKVSEDIDRNGKGAYSPVSRDYAQDARSGFFDQILYFDGEETYNIIKELSIAHPLANYREYIAYQAKKFAENASELNSFSENEFLEFINSFQISPKNEEDLFQLVKIKLEDMKHEFEDGDNSPYRLLLNQGEEVIRQFIARELRRLANNKYSVAQEDELADDKRPDIRIYGNGFDNPITIELKVSNKWSGNELLDSLNTQVYGSYLRDYRSTKAFFLLINLRSKKYDIFNERANFERLIEILNQESKKISEKMQNIQFVEVIGIDITKRKIPKASQK